MERHLDDVARNVPRYTSYPTAPHFTENVNGAISAAWMEEIPADATSDPADVLIGVGASAIGRLPQGYVRNAADIGGWGRALKAGRLPTVRGRRLDRDDLLRGDIIEVLMCFFECDLDQACARHGAGRRELAGCHEDLERMARDGLIRFSGNRVTIPPESRPFTRVVAAAFDAYLAPATGRHSAAV